MKKVIPSLLLTIILNIFAAENQTLTSLKKSLDEQTNNLRALSESYESLTVQYATLKSESDKRKAFDERRIEQRVNELSVANNTISTLNTRITNLTNEKNIVRP